MNLSLWWSPPANTKLLSLSPITTHLRAIKLQLCTFRKKAANKSVEIRSRNRKLFYWPTNLNKYNLLDWRNSYAWSKLHGGRPQRPSDNSPPPTSTKSHSKTTKKPISSTTTKWTLPSEYTRSYPQVLSTATLLPSSTPPSNKPSSKTPSNSEAHLPIKISTLIRQPKHFAKTATISLN